MVKTVENQNDNIISDQNYLKDKICSVFDELNSRRQTQKDDIKEVEQAIFLKKKDKFQMTDLFELYQTFKSHIWENLYSNLDLLFDVKGQNEESEKTALLQKHNLQKYFEAAKLQNVLDDAIDYLIRKSEAIIFVGWKMQEKFIRRKKNVVIPAETPNGLNKIRQEIVVEKKKIYDGLDLRAIDPENLVFDVDDKKYFIYQSFVSMSELANIKGFNCLTPEKFEQIKTYVNSNTKNANVKGIIDDKIELLEYWGDIKLADGSVAYNQVVVVAAREFVVRQELNPYIINPFVVMEILKDPDTKRGFVYLKTALPMKEKAQQIFINQLRALEFITNPAYLAPKGAFANISQDAEPGKIIEYEPSLMPQAPAPLNMSGALQGWEFLSYLKNIEETSTGIFKNFGGVIDKTRTATEVEATVGGQNSRLAMIIDQINQYLIIPVIEKSADLIANLIFDKETIFINQNEGSITEVIDENVRNGEYKYIYGDRNAVQVRKFKIKEMLDICANMLKTFPELQKNINPTEALKFVLEQYGYDNFERFKNNDIIENNEQSPDLSSAWIDKK
ncbi:MAG: hypothetical protein MJ180_00525 [Candidatus Gastranaerophilales bacterium]|nr:hypothetical protein [Candidatus Gastranaerophilales bacterium]